MSLDKTLSHLLLTLDEMLEEVRDNVDTVDGSDGTPRPNWAMRFMTDFGDKLGQQVESVRIKLEDRGAEPREGTKP